MDSVDRSSNGRNASFSRSRFCSFGPTLARFRPRLRPWRVNRANASNKPCADLLSLALWRAAGHPREERARFLQVCSQPSAASFRWSINSAGAAHPCRASLLARAQTLDVVRYRASAGQPRLLKMTQILKKASSSKISDSYTLGQASCACDLAVCLRLTRSSIRTDDNSACDTAQVLGKGAFGTVVVAADKKTNKVYACKSIEKAKLVSEVSCLAAEG